MLCRGQSCFFKFDTIHCQYLYICHDERINGAALQGHLPERYCIYLTFICASMSLFISAGIGKDKSCCFVLLIIGCLVFKGLLFPKVSSELELADESEQKGPEV